jgi:hypothetical protein
MKKNPPTGLTMQMMPRMTRIGLAIPEFNTGERCRTTDPISPINSIPNSPPDSAQFQNADAGVFLAGCSEILGGTIG